MQRNRGATLLETLLALVTGSIILLAFLGSIVPVQSLAWDVSAMHDRDSTLCLGPPLLCKWAAGVGNHRSKQSGNSILIQAGTLYLESDTDGATGFPDGELQDNYESIWIRQNGTDLQLRSGTGSFQPVFRNVSGFKPTLANPRLLRLSLGAQIDKSLIGLPKAEPKLVSFHVYLWNYRPNLFEEDN